MTSKETIDSPVSKLRTELVLEGKLDVRAKSVKTKWTKFKKLTIKFLNEKKIGKTDAAAGCSGTFGSKIGQHPGRETFTGQISVENFQGQTTHYHLLAMMCNECNLQMNKDVKSGISFHVPWWFFPLLVSLWNFHCRTFSLTTACYYNVHKELLRILSGHNNFYCEVPT